MFKVPEKNRITAGHLASDPSYGNNGAFKVPYKHGQIHYVFFVIASDGMGWEHVSVSFKNVDRSPTWDEMCFIKNIFWDDTDTVLQYHPPKSKYINNHPHCLHLWRPIDKDVPVPETYLVGTQNAE